MANFSIDHNSIMISGDISIRSGESLVNFLKGYANQEDKVIVDLRSVESWDSSSFQTFIAWMKTLHEQKVLWKNMPQEMREEITLMGLSNMFSGVNNE